MVKDDIGVPSIGVLDADGFSVSHLPAYSLTTLPSFWYLAYTKPRQEALAKNQLLRQNYQVYLPTLKMLKRGQNTQVDFVPLFPRYIFFKVSDPTQSISPARSTVGITNLVRFGHTLATLSHETVQKLQQLEVIQHSKERDILCPFQSGSPVTAIEGPFMGLEGLVSHIAKDRVMVLMHLLGKETVVSFPAHSLQILT